MMRMSQGCNIHVDFSSMNDQEIARFLQQEQVKLTVQEAQKIQSLLKRPPTLAECILWSIQGSEHCSYKSTKHYLKQLPTDAPNIILGPKEDAGVVEVARDNLGRRYGVVMSHESHNHPSQIVPFEGAATGVGGNVRDVSCMGAEVIAVADSLRFGAIDHPKTHWIDKGVVSGIASYANAIGVPNLAGDLYYDEAYKDNCLVTVVTLGLLREDELIHSYAPANAEGYSLILVGKATDGSGFGGASFASLVLDETQVQQNKGAVQEPNAFLGRHLIQANSALCKKLKEMGQITNVGFKDLGAGGIACASVELADGAGYGASVQLEEVHTSDTTLPPQVILCAETQERYMWVVPPELKDIVLTHYNDIWQLPIVSPGAKASVIGTINADKQFVVTFHGETLVNAKASDVTQGLTIDRPHRPRTVPHQERVTVSLTLEQKLKSLLNDPNYVSHKPIYECYDKQVQGRTVLERGAASAGVMTPFNSNDYPPEIQSVGIALALAHNPQLGKQNAYWTGFHAIISSMRKVIAVGAKPAALTDCLCFANPENPEHMQDIIDAIAGISDACKAVPLFDYPEYPTPVISGNVSLYNESAKGAIPASPIVSCLGVLEDIKLLTTPDLQQSESMLLVLGEQTLQAYAKPEAKSLALELFSVMNLIRQELLLSCVAIDFSGVAYALMTASFRKNIGFTLQPEYGESDYLFCNNGGFLLEVSPQNYDKVCDYLKRSAQSYHTIGKTIAKPEWQWNSVLTTPISQAHHGYTTRLRELRK